MSKLCEGRVAIVTGGARGLGRAHSLMLAEHGAKVVINDIGVSLSGHDADMGPAEALAQEIRDAGGEAIVDVTDVGDWAGVERMIARTVEHFGRLDVLVNNAGNLRDRMIVNLTEDDWDAVIRVHLKGTFATLQHAGRYWRGVAKETGAPVDARIINTTSATGLFGQVGQANYGAAKAGITSLTQIAAMEFKNYGVTVNAIGPHAQTRMTEGLKERTAEEIAQRDPRFVAALVCWLASAESRDVTGRVFQVGDGLLKVAEGWRAGPGIEPTLDPTALADGITDIVRRAQPNANMKGIVE